MVAYDTLWPRVHIGSGQSTSYSSGDGTATETRVRRMWTYVSSKRGEKYDVDRDE
ncbi:hypothetical protein [Halobellus sp. GM3]|uniref:hypothetical protein n=1 Tax=Halobellus sp. GM3 TaxID=3458410 RepID=UPI00403E177A